MDPLRRVISPVSGLSYFITTVDGYLRRRGDLGGGSLVGVSWKGIDSGFFWSAMQNAVDWRMDLVNCLIKSVVFAITRRGFRCLTATTPSRRLPGLAGQPLAPLSTRLWLFWGWILC